MTDLLYIKENLVTVHNKSSKISRFKQLFLGNHSEFDRCSYKLFLLIMTDTVTSQNIDLSSWITLYKDPDNLETRTVRLTKPYSIEQRE